MCIRDRSRIVKQYEVELPGPILLGEGKPNNQNHAIIFTRGEALQAIDMNQDGGAWPKERGALCEETAGLHTVFFVYGPLQHKQRSFFMDHNISALFCVFLVPNSPQQYVVTVLLSQGSVFISSAFFPIRHNYCCNGDCCVFVYFIL